MIHHSKRVCLIVNSIELFKEKILENNCAIEVVTLNFEVKKLAESLGIKSTYLDKIETSEKSHELNAEIAKFLENWYRDAQGRDIFNYQGIDFGRSFLLKIWSEVIYKASVFVNLEYLEIEKYSEVLIESNMQDVIHLFSWKHLEFTSIEHPKNLAEIQLFFDITNYMDKAFALKDFKSTLRNTLLKANRYFGHLVATTRRSKTSKVLYVQLYHPTKPIVDNLKKNRNYRIVTNGVFGKTGISKYFTEQNVFAIRNFEKKHSYKAAQIIDRFKFEKNETERVSKFENLTLEDYLLEVILELIQDETAVAIYSIEEILKFSQKNTISLYISIANLGTFETVLDEFCRLSGIPRFLIINGYLSNDHYIDSREADVINCYSESIRNDFYRNSSKAVALGDPRMDKYAIKLIRGKQFSEKDYEKFTIGIGTAGYNNVDVISYLAFEFEFIHDVFQVLDHFKSLPVKEICISLRVRSNGVRKQYVSFIEKFFPDMAVEIVEVMEFSEFIEGVDLYISTYSQTLFEAAAIGIPVIYFKKDLEVLNPPFDGNSELVTALDKISLLNCIEDVLDERKASFATLSTKEIEKYFGSLDGQNLKRNIQLIDSLINGKTDNQNAK